MGPLEGQVMGPIPPGSLTVRPLKNTETQKERRQEESSFAIIFHNHHGFQGLLLLNFRGVISFFCVERFFY